MKFEPATRAIMKRLRKAVGSKLDTFQVKNPGQSPSIEVPAVCPLAEIIVQVL